MTVEACTHVDLIRQVTPSADGCEDCLRIGGWWIHLRMCLTCGHVGCCNSSPNRHASTHAREVDHPVAQAWGADEDWIWCFVDEVYVEPGVGD